MYCKLFASLYQGTLRGASHEILVFTNLLAHASRDGIVDKHFRAIAEETGLTVDEVKAALLVLEAPDPESRSPEEAGARIVRMDEHRVWGWRIVNYGKYRAIRSEEDRAEQNRLAQERWRNKNKPPSAESKQDKPMQKERQKQKDKDVGANGSPPQSGLNWLDGLSKDPTYAGIDVKREFGKMSNWCKVNSKTPTQRRFLNWLNRCEKPLIPFTAARSIPKEQPDQWPEFLAFAYPEAKEHDFNRVPDDVKREFKTWRSDFARVKAEMGR